MCLKCGSKTNNPKFCSRSCSASYNNKLFPRRIWKCRECGLSNKRNGNSRVCLGCRKRWKSNSGGVFGTKTESLTMGYIRNSSRDKGYSVANMFTRIRVSARKKLKLLGISSCYVCGYDKHWQAAHIKPVSSFGDDEYVASVNDINNLVALCPNHHWELDHGLLSLAREANQL